MSAISQTDFQTITQWLRSLGVLCAGTMTAEDAKMRCAAYADLVSAEFPVTAFTRKSLEHVASKCKFFPSYGELVQHLGEIWRENLPAHVRLGGSLDVPSLAAPKYEPSEDEVADVRAKVDAFKAEMAAKPSPIGEAKIKPRYLSKLEIALVSPPDVLAIRPDLREALRLHKESAQ
jgi:hypothetical protein